MYSVDTTDPTHPTSKVRITDQAGKWKEYNYDALGRLTKASEPDGAVTRDTTYSRPPADGGWISVITRWGG